MNLKSGETFPEMSRYNINTNTSNPSQRNGQNKDIILVATTIQNETVLFSVRIFSTTVSTTTVSAMPVQESIHTPPPRGSTFNPSRSLFQLGSIPSKWYDQSGNAIVGDSWPSVKLIDICK